MDQALSDRRQGGRQAGARKPAAKALFGINVSANVVRSRTGRRHLLNAQITILAKKAIEALDAHTAPEHGVSP